MLNQFHTENKRLKEIALQIADLEGMKLREKQESLFKEIRNKYTQMVSC
jgi:hypothetical protein